MLVFSLFAVMILLFIGNILIISKKINLQARASECCFHSPRWIYVLYCICFFLNLLIFFTIAFIIEAGFPKDVIYKECYMWFLLPVFFVFQLYYAILMHVKHYYFLFHEDAIEYFLGIKTKGTYLPVKIFYSQINSLEFTRARLIINLDSGERKSILLFKLNLIAGASVIKEKLIDNTN